MSQSFAIRIALNGFLACTLAGLAAAQSTWYVDVNATPPGAGTQANPFASIQFAIDQATTLTGDTVLVAPGTYFEAVYIGKNITVRSSNGPLVTTIDSNGVDDGAVVGQVSAVLEGFTVTTATAGWSGVFLVDGTVRRCIVRDCAQAISGIEVFNGKIEASTIVRNFQYGVTGSPHFGAIQIRNSISWGNLQGNISGGMFNSAYNAGFAGVENVTGDPGFWDLAAGDFSLRSGSPCIDAGDPTGPLDPDGSRMDIGALTFDATYAPAPTSYCIGKVNSQGCTPTIGSIGAASATSSAQFMITATNEVENKVGLFIFGFASSAQPFQGGTLCVAPPIKRAAVQNSSGTGPCTGHFRFFMQDYIQSGVHPGLLPGALVYGQWWGRDPLDPAGFGSSLSDALRFGIAP